MKFISLLPVRDEADIISQCLDALLMWCDEIYVFDTGSVDETWELVNDYRLREKRIIAMRKDDVFFSETLLRGWMFHQARKNLKNGDWFLRVDADEFHHIPPPQFVRERMKKHETVAFHQYYNFQYTEREAALWKSGVESVLDRTRPIEQRRRWYTESKYAEPRLCRYRESMKWPERASFPYNAGFVSELRLPIRHYPHRDPIQMEKRCRLRAVMMADEENSRHWRRPDLHHWSEAEWRKFIIADNSPQLKYWSPESPLPEVAFRNHLARPHIRTTQRLVHLLALPVLDRLRPSMKDCTYPQRIPPDKVAQLRNILS